MEEKKSLKANLDAKRPLGFLLGLVIALACLFAGLEYVAEPDDPLDDPDLLARLTTEEELSAFMKDDNELQLAPKAEPKPSVEITVVEDEPLKEQIQEEKPVETDMDNDMEAMEEKEEPPQPPTEEEEERFRIVRDLPQFPGGLTEFTKWLTRNLKYPKSLENRKIEGSVIAEFMVNTDGSITDVKIVQTLHPDCDNEVLRVLRMMPRWTPGIENDKPCRTVVRVPVVFNS